MEKSIHLSYREGSSDKVYQASIEAKDKGYVVNFAYGRRGATLATGTKTNTPVDIASAQKIFDKLVREKTGKGYTTDESGVPYLHMDKEQQDSGFQCQLLNPIQENEVPQYIHDDQYVGEEKKDGERRPVQKKGNNITGINRKGLSVGFPETFNQLLNINQDFLIDCEIIGEKLYPFDILELGGQDLRNKPYGDRLTILDEFLGENNSIEVLGRVTRAYSTKGKQKLFDQLKKDNAEGIVFKRLDAPYSPGRPASGGTQFKYKFYTTGSFMVHEVNDKRSVAIGLYGEKGEFLEAGNVTIPANHPIPQTGDVVEVRYLYAFKESGSVFQPTYLGQRSDIDKSECVVSQLKYKQPENI